jgi:hypothetical protein
MSTLYIHTACLCSLETLKICSAHDDLLSYLVRKSTYFLLVRLFSGISVAGSWTSANVNPLNISIPTTLSYPCCNVLHYLSFLFCPGCLSVLSWLLSHTAYHCYLVPAVLSRLSCPRTLVPSSTVLLPILSLLSFSDRYVLNGVSGHPIPTVPFLLSYTGCPGCNGLFLQGCHECKVK